MLLAKFTRQAGLCIRKQTTPGGSGLRLLGRIWPSVTPVAVRPCMALAHHPLAHIRLLPADARQNAAIVVATSAIDADCLPDQLALQRLTRCLAMRLADFRRVHAINTDLHGLPTRCRAHKDGVAIRHIGHHALPL